MRPKVFLNELLQILSSVLTGASNYTELQKYVDDALINDRVPEGISNSTMKCIYSLQTDLEIIAENQATMLGSRCKFTQKDIVDRLRKYEELGD